MRNDTYCMYCMSHVADQARSCPTCYHVSKDVTNMAYQLPPGTVLNHRYMVGRVLGSGGFGITYVGRDLNLDMKVAIKEYYPSAFASRHTHLGTRLVPNTGFAQQFQAGKNRFLREARMMAQLSQEKNIVRVCDYFEANDTCYIVMEYLEGISLREYLKDKKRLTEKQTMDLLLPVMDSLSRVHQHGLIHRDIAPDNIMILRDGSVKLLDFGAAKDYVDSGTATVILKEGYAPVEQYSGKGDLGPWTDVYALAATMYCCVTGQVPPAAVERLTGAALSTPSSMGISLSPSMEQAILTGLAVFKDKRYLSVDAFKKALTSNVKAAQASSKKAAQAPSGSAASGQTFKRTVVSSEPKKAAAPLQTKKKKKKRWFGKFVLAVLVLLAGVYAYTQFTAVQIGESKFALNSERIYVSGEVVTSSQLEKISGFKKLTDLSLVDCTLTNGDVGIIADELSQLDIDESKPLRLDISMNEGITDISPLAKVYQLTDLCVSYCSIADFSALSKLDRLSYLYAEMMKVPVMTETFSGVNGLYSLNLSYNNLSDLAFLSDMNLGELMIRGNQVSSLEPLTHMDHLAYLYLDDNQITDLSVLEGKLEGLYNFSAENNQITDISVLAQCKKLYDINLSNNKISDISALWGLPVKFLNISNNQISDIGVLESMKEMLFLYMHHNQIVDITPLKNMTSLSELEFHHNQIEDLTPMMHLDVGVCGGDFSYNNISDLSPLRKARYESWFILQLQGNPISDFSPLSGVDLGECTTVYLNYNDYIDWSALGRIFSEDMYIHIVDAPKERENEIAEATGHPGTVFDSSEELNQNE